MTDTQFEDRTAAMDGVQMDDGSNAGQEMTVAQGGPPRTVAQERKAKAEKVIKELAARAETYKPMLKAHGIDWDIFVAVLQQAFVKVPSLLECSTASILEAAFKCAKDGLMPDGDEAALTPFKKTATYVVGYKGMLKIAYAMKDGAGALVYMDVEVDVIYEDEADKFEYRRGDGGYIHFAPPLDRSIDKPVVGAYCIIRTNNGGVFREVIGGKELAKIASVNKAQNGPRSTWAAQMHAKGPLRRLLKKTPKDFRLTQMLHHDEEAYIPGGAAQIDDGRTEIPDDKLFDDTRHQAETAAETDDAASQIVQDIRTDLMACADEAALDAVLAKVKKTPKKTLCAADRATVLENAETLRAHRWPKQEVETDGATADEDDDLTRPLDPEKLAEAKAAQQRPTSAAAPTVTERVQSAEHQPATSASAPLASTASPGPTASSPKLASEATSAGAAAAESAETIGKGGSYTVNPALRQGHSMAPPERRLTPQEALLDEENGVHFKKGFTANASGQIPYFNQLGEIIGFAKEDLDIPWREAGEDTSAAAARPSEAAPAVQQAPAAAEAQPAADDDSGYGDEEAEIIAEFTPARYLLKVKPTEPPMEYEDPVVWRDALIFKMGALTPVSGPRWWADNKDFVVAALATAKPQAGRILDVAATKKWDGAKELVEQYGPFQ